MNKCQYCGGYHASYKKKYSFSDIGFKYSYPYPKKKYIFFEEKDYINKSIMMEMTGGDKIYFRKLKNKYITPTFRFVDRYDFMRFDHKIYISAELFEYIRIMFETGKIDFWDLIELAEIHDLPLITAENSKNPEPNDKIVMQITI